MLRCERCNLPRDSCWHAVTFRW